MVHISNFELNLTYTFYFEPIQLVRKLVRSVFSTSIPKFAYGLAGKYKIRKYLEISGFFFSKSV